MSAAVICDQCDSMLRVNPVGDDENGERAAWITLGLAGESFEVCSVSCAVVFLERPEVAEGIADHLDGIVGVVRIIRGDTEDE